MKGEGAVACVGFDPEPILPVAQRNRRDPGGCETSHGPTVFRIARFDPGTPGQSKQARQGGKPGQPNDSKIPQSRVVFGSLQHLFDQPAYEAGLAQVVEGMTSVRA